MKLSRSLLRRVTKALFWPAIIVLALNIENLASALGWDKLLTPGSPLVSSILGAIQSGWIQFPAVFILGAGIVLWIDSLLRRNEAAIAKPTSGYVSPFAGKRQSPPPTIPPHIVNVIDEQDERINAFISTGRVIIQKHFEAPDPYIDINILLLNGSVFDLTYEGLQGRLFYRDDPIKDRPEMLSHEGVLRHNKGAIYVLRQFLGAELRDLMISHQGQHQELNPSQDFCIRFKYTNHKGDSKKASWTILPELFVLTGLYG